MVDAVSAVNAAINTIVQQRKDVSINWKDLSAKEVLEHAGKGEDVPLEVLKWAEDISKLEDVPDDVSYDSVGGERQRDEVIEAAADDDSIATDDVKTEAAEESDKTEETDETKDEEETEPTNQEDTNSPEALYNQGVVLNQESNDGTNSVNESVTKSVARAAQSQKDAENAAKVAEQTVTKVKSDKSEYDKLVNKLTSDKSNIQVSDLNKLNNLSKNLNRNGSRAQSNIGVYDAQIQQIESEFAQYSKNAELTKTTGESTVEIGNKLIDLVPPDEREDNAESSMEVSATMEEQRSDYRFVFNRYYAMGRTDVSSGANAQSAADSGMQAIDSNAEINSGSESAIRESQNKVEELTMVDGKTFSSNVENKENQKEVDAKLKEEKLNRNASGNKTDLNGVKDSTLLSDSLEIQRRKEMRGEQPPQT